MSFIQGFDFLRAWRLPCTSCLQSSGNPARGTKSATGVCARRHQRTVAAATDPVAKPLLATTHLTTCDTIIVTEAAFAVVCALCVLHGDQIFTGGRRWGRTTDSRRADAAHRSRQPAHTHRVRDILCANPVLGAPFSIYELRHAPRNDTPRLVARGPGANIRFGERRTVDLVRGAPYGVLGIVPPINIERV